MHPETEYIQRPTARGNLQESPNFAMNRPRSSSFLPQEQVFSSQAMPLNYTAPSLFHVSTNPLEQLVAQPPPPLYYMVPPFGMVPNNLQEQLASQPPPLYYMVPPFGTVSNNPQELLTSQPPPLYYMVPPSFGIVPNNLPEQLAAQPPPLYYIVPPLGMVPNNHPIQYPNQGGGPITNVYLSQQQQHNQERYPGKYRPTAMAQPTMIQPTRYQPNNETVSAANRSTVLQKRTYAPTVSSSSDQQISLVKILPKPDNTISATLPKRPRLKEEIKPIQPRPEVFPKIACVQGGVNLSSMDDKTKITPKSSPSTTPVVVSPSFTISKESTLNAIDLTDGDYYSSEDSTNV